MNNQTEDQKTEKSGKTIVVYNAGTRTYHTSRGPLEPEKSIEFSEEEGKAHLDYPDLRDGKKFVPQSQDVDALRQENEELKARLKEFDSARLTEQKVLTSKRDK